MRFEVVCSISIHQNKMVAIAQNRQIRRVRNPKLEQLAFLRAL